MTDTFLGRDSPALLSRSGGGFEDRLPGREAVVAKQRPESAQNRASGLPVELLVDDGMSERLEGREAMVGVLGRG